MCKGYLSFVNTTRLEWLSTPLFQEGKQGSRGINTLLITQVRDLQFPF